MIQKELILEYWTDYLEREMMFLNPGSSLNERRYYLAAIIDTLENLGIITGDVREILYEQYVM